MICFMLMTFFVLMTGCKNKSKDKKTEMITSIDGIEINLLDGLDKIMSCLSDNKIYVYSYRDPISQTTYYEGKKVRLSELIDEAVKITEIFDGKEYQHIEEVLDKDKKEYLSLCSEKMPIVFWDEEDVLFSLRESFTLENYDMYGFTINAGCVYDRKLVEFEILNGKNNPSELGTFCYEIPGFQCLENDYRYKYKTQESDIDNRKGYVIVYIDGKAVDLSKYYNNYDKCIEAEENDCSWLVEPIKKIMPDVSFHCAKFDYNLDIQLSDNKEKADKIRNRFSSLNAFSDAINKIADCQAENVVMIRYYTDNNEGRTQNEKYADTFVEYWVFKRN